MEQTLIKIQKIFSGFSDFCFQFDIENRKVINFDFDKMDYSLYNEVKQIETFLQRLYLQGNDLVLKRVKEELLKIENLLQSLDFGFNFRIEKYDYCFTIEPELVTKINLLKLNYVKQLIEFINKLFMLQQADAKAEEQTENDFTLSTIDDWLFEFKEKMSEADYQTLVSALKQYFETEEFPILSKPIQVKGRLNKKLVGWALNKIFEAKGRGVELALLRFAKQNISLFAKVPFDETLYTKSNLYKYFTTQTK